MNRAHARMEARICLAVRDRTAYHPASDAHGDRCAACAQIRAEAHTRCELLHATAPRYVDGRGVLRFHCCYRRVDGAEG